MEMLFPCQHGLLGARETDPGSDVPARLKMKRLLTTTTPVPSITGTVTISCQSNQPTRVAQSMDV